MESKTFIVLIALLVPSISFSAVLATLQQKVKLACGSLLEQNRSVLSPFVDTLKGGARFYNSGQPSPNVKLDRFVPLNEGDRELITWVQRVWATEFREVGWYEVIDGNNEIIARFPALGTLMDLYGGVRLPMGPSFKNMVDHLRKHNLTFEVAEVRHTHVHIMNSENHQRFSYGDLRAYYQVRALMTLAGLGRANFAASVLEPIEPIETGARNFEKFTLNFPFTMNWTRRSFPLPPATKNRFIRIRAGQESLDSWLQSGSQ